MKFWKRFVSTLLVTALLLSPTQLFAAEAATDLPDAWALKEVFLAETFGLSVEGVGVNFKETMPLANFEKLHNAFCARLEVEDGLNVPANGIVTRGYVLEELYDTIRIAAGKDAGDLTALDYFVGNGLINGRADGQYALDKPCTTQEAILFATRAYIAISQYLDRGAKGFLWKVSDEDNTVYLLGSIHLADFSMYPLSPAIMAAYDDSEALIVEVDISEVDVDEMTQLVLEKALYNDGTLLEDVLSKETFDNLLMLLESSGYPRELVNLMRPWYAQLLLTSLPSGGTTATGIDPFLIVLAILDEKPIVSLETAVDQIEMFASMSEEAQIYLLESELSARIALSKEENDALTEQVFGSLLEAWYLGDLEKMDEAFGLSTETDEVVLEYYNKVNTERNEKMLPKIEILLNEFEENIMVVVGTMHMMYDVGLVKGLENLGYTVERIQ